MAKPDKIRAVDEGVPAQAWRRVSWVTPILDSWKAIVALLALLVFQNLDLVRELKNLDLHDQDVVRILLWAGLVLVVIFAIIALFSYFSWRAMTYAVTDQAVWLRKGIIFRSQRHVRFERVQSVDMVHPLLGRIFGLGKLTVEAAGGTGSNLSIGFLPTVQLAQLRNEVLAGAAGIRESHEDSVTSTPPEQSSLRSAETGRVFGQQPPPQVRAEMQEAPETQLYAVSVGRLIASTLMSGTFVVGVLMIVAIIISTGVVLSLGESDAFWGLLAGVVPVVLVLVTLGWGRFAGDFNFRAAVSPDGIRIRRGLVESVAETIPPRRIHGVEISQPFLWRIAGWYRVSITQAAKVSGEQGSTRVNNVLLPVGDQHQALLALWLVLPGLEDPAEIFTEALHGRRTQPQWVGVPRRAWVFDPLVYRRAAIRLTETAAVIRGGRITRFGKFIAYERIQSLVVDQGPLDRLARVESVLLAMVPGSFQMLIQHLSLSDAANVTAHLANLSSNRRSAEPPEKWLARVERGLATGATVSIGATTGGENGDRSHAQPASVTIESAQRNLDNDRWKPQ